MADNSLGDEPKVMDINRPGRGRIMQPSSRPIVAPLVSGGAKDNDIKVDTPSSSHKVIEPLRDIEKTEDDKEENTNQQEYTQSSEEVKPEYNEESDKSETSEVTEDKTDNEDSNKHEEPNMSGSSEVDALASNAAEKREAKQKAEEELKKQEELKQMIESKEYFIPISSSSASKRWQIVFIILGILILVGLIIAIFIMTSK